MYGIYRPIGPHSSYVGPRAGQFNGQPPPPPIQQQQQQMVGVPMNTSVQSRFGIQYGVTDSQYMGFQNHNGFVNGNGYNQPAEFSGQQSSDFGVCFLVLLFGQVGLH